MWNDQHLGLTMYVNKSIPCLHVIHNESQSDTQKTIMYADNVMMANDEVVSTCGMKLRFQIKGAWCRRYNDILH
jgi:hypothetical protein